MLVVTTDNIQGKTCEPIGAVRGIAVLTRNLGRDIGSGFKNLVGGEMKAYQELLDNSSKLALERLVSAAEAMGADAVTGMRYTTSSITQGGAEVLAYGTAVKYI